MRIRMATVAKVIAEEFNVTVEQIKSPSRVRRIIIPRFSFYWLSYKYGHSLPKIAAWTGGRDHTTVLHGKNIIDAYIGFDKLNELDSKVQMFNNQMYRQIEGEDDE